LDRNLAPGVSARAGYSGCDYPREVRWQGSRLPVARVINEWREPGSKHYLVETENGLCFRLTLSEINAQWLVSPVRIKTRPQG